jgi:S-adenosylmethionine:tRNA ribosyltransferase-isomerase
MSSPFNLSSYQFDLPEELIAQHPVTPRDASRLMVVEKKTGRIYEVSFREILHILEAEDRLVFNNTKVIPARLYGKLCTGGNAEVLLIKQADPSAKNPNQWKAFVRPGKKLKEGAKIHFANDAYCIVLDVLEEGERVLQFEYPHASFDTFLEEAGELPLPHYIRRESLDKSDTERYQTVYAKSPGAVAAPTAGLHFTPDLLKQLDEKNVHQSFVTLHVGPGTFKPVLVDDIREHKMHKEEFWIETETADAINSTTGRLIAVGTTSCRALESAAGDNGKVIPGHYDTDIFIYPGYTFKKLDHLLTNFHLPGSSLIMLVSSLLGTDLTKEVYQLAIEKKFRFYSYGDAMLIL